MSTLTTFVRDRGVAAFGLLAMGACMALAAPSCLDDATATDFYACPDRQIFVDNVSPLVERRCGTLDCHGSTKRPMRIYGELGLRHPLELNRSGLNPTTPLELEANYNSICNVEPEKVDQVVNDFGNSVTQLLLVRKGRGQEGHKGGQTLNPNDDADRCIVGWMRGDTPQEIKASCDSALARLP